MKNMVIKGSLKEGEEADKHEAAVALCEDLDLDLKKEFSLNQPSEKISDYKLQLFCQRQKMCIVLDYRTSKFEIKYTLEEKPAPKMEETKKDSKTKISKAPSDEDEELPFE